MRSFRNAWWVFVINVIPISILFLIFHGAYQLIEDVLSPTNHITWSYFFVGLGGLWFIHIGYTLLIILKRKELDYYYGINTLLIYCVFLYLYFIFCNNIIPGNIPAWILAENKLLYATIFVLPTIIHSITVIILNTTPLSTRKIRKINIILAMIIPPGWLGLFNLVLPQFHFNHNTLQWHILLILAIGVTIGLLFVFLKQLYIIFLKNKSLWRYFSRLGKLTLSLAFPLAGFCVSNEMLFELVFGNLSNTTFYILAFLNAIVVCLPEFHHRIYRLTIFVVRSITFGYILYFILSNLSTLPISALALACFGMGALMVVPIILLILKINLLANDFKFLIASYMKHKGASSVDLLTR